MRLGDIRLYYLEIYQNSTLIFDDEAKNLSDDLKDITVQKIQLSNGKLKIEI